MGPCMSAINKIWGTTEPLVITPLFEMHRLVINPEHRCSLHVHRYKWNAFYVISGSLFIDTVVGDLGAPVITVGLDAGDHTTLAPGLHHQFRTAVHPCCAIEMYYTEPLSEDIIRRNVGGPI